MKIQNLSQLKKAINNKDIKELTLVDSQVCFNGKEHPSLNKTRTIETIQTNSIKFAPLDKNSQGSWLEYPQASLIEFKDNNIIVIYDPKEIETETGQRDYDYKQKGKMVLTYKY